MEREFTRQLNLSINGHLINLRDEAINEANVNEIIDIIKNTQENMQIRNVGEREEKSLASTPVCPDHDRAMKKSQFGGYYCPTKDESTGKWCFRKA